MEFLTALTEAPQLSRRQVAIVPGNHDVNRGHPVTDKSVTEARRHAVLLPEGSSKLEGDSGHSLWWSIKQCRSEPGELDPHGPTIRRLPTDVPIPR